VHENHNQYARSAGHPALCQVLARRYSKVFGGRAINWETDVAVGVGGSETLYAIMQGLVNPGDEVILVSPAFDIYSAQVLMAGGVPKYVPLRMVPDAADPSRRVWDLDLAELRAAFSERTRLVVLNSPQNPTGRLLTRAEYEQIAAIMDDFPRVVAVSDEVYEFMVYGQREHWRLATAVPRMFDRCLTVSSGGKTFSCTGWKVGWVVGPPQLVKGVVVTNQWVQFSVSTPAQQAIAWALEEAEKPYEGHASYFHWLLDSYTRKRAVLMEGLSAAGLRPVEPEGGFFIIANTCDVEVPQAYLDETTPASGPSMPRDWALCRWLAKEVGVVAIPPSAFYQEADRHLAKDMARFAFCKEDASLEEACKRLLKVRQFLKKD
jgi:kynurenine--oxoglutarate transaminase/cysteine-S-conjugate beta-lyase/glutamine--phenylpyruvate transaminase